MDACTRTEISALTLKSDNSRQYQQDSVLI